MSGSSSGRRNYFSEKNLQISTSSSGRRYGFIPKEERITIQSNYRTFFIRNDHKLLKTIYAISGEIQITFPETQSFQQDGMKNEYQVSIIGDEKAVECAKELILSHIRRAGDICSLTVHYPHKIHKQIIGENGEKINNIGKSNIVTIYTPLKGDDVFNWRDYYPGIFDRSFASPERNRRRRKILNFVENVTIKM